MSAAARERAAIAAHRDGTCRCDDVGPCTLGHVGAEQGHCECGDPTPSPCLCIEEDCPLDHAPGPGVPGWVPVGDGE